MKKYRPFLIALAVIIVIVIIFVPPLFDAKGKGSLFNQFIHRNDLPKQPK